VSNSDSPPIDKARAARLRRARIEAGFRSAREACRRLGWAYGTYSSHENANRNIPLDTIAIYAGTLHVPVDWLAYGQGGDVRRSNRVRIEGYVSGDLEIHMRLPEIPDEIPDDAETPPGAMTQSLHAWRFSDEDNAPFHRSGDVVYTLRNHEAPRAYVGEICVVLLTDGRRQIRLIRAHLGDSRFLLDDLRHNVLEAELVDASPIAWTRHSRYADIKI
jgi:transcriptional regulator with XRE-family HTH domain